MFKTMPKQYQQSSEKKRLMEQMRGSDQYAAMRQMASLMGNQAMLGMMQPQGRYQKEQSPFFDDMRKKFGQKQNPERQASPARQSSGGTSLPDYLREKFEKKSGLPMDDVRVHYNSDKPAELGALAYTQGTDVHIGPGQEEHLEHELVHVVQQKQGRVTQATQLSGKLINNDNHLEREASNQKYPCLLGSLPKPQYEVIQMCGSENQDDEDSEDAYYKEVRVDGAGLPMIVTIGDQELQTAEQAINSTNKTLVLATSLDYNKSDAIQDRRKQLRKVARFAHIPHVMLGESGELQHITSRKNSENRKAVHLRNINARKSTIAFDHPYTTGFARRKTTQNEVKQLCSKLYSAANRYRFGRSRITVRAISKDGKNMLAPYELKATGQYVYDVKRSSLIRHATTNQRNKAHSINPSEQSLVIKYGNFSILFRNLITAAKKYQNSHSGFPHERQRKRTNQVKKAFKTALKKAVRNRRFPKNLKERLKKKRYFLDKANLILSFDPEQEDSFEKIYRGPTGTRSMHEYMNNLSTAKIEFSEDDLD